MEHRLVYEHYLKILFDEDVYIPKQIEVHHIIPVDKGGTNALINLEVKTHKEHRRHHIIDTSDRRCNVCGSDKTKMVRYDDLMRPVWHRDRINGGFKCSRCYIKDPIIKQRKNQLGRERRRRKRLLKQLKINTLDKYSD
jgi:hypothetical protein